MVNLEISSTDASFLRGALEFYFLDSMRKLSRQSLSDIEWSIAEYQQRKSIELIKEINNLTGQMP